MANKKRKPEGKSKRAKGESESEKSRGGEKFIHQNVCK
jgi:hypothetical protein